MPELRGRAASPGISSGRCFVLRVDGEIGRPISPYVLVARFTTPEVVSLLVRAEAIVTDVGGVLSHAAIIARELGIPCVVGTANATSLIPEGQWVTVDGKNGIVTWLGGTPSSELSD